MTIIWNPPKDLVNESNVMKFMENKNIKDYKELVRKSIEDIKWWWNTCQEILGIKWDKSYDKILDMSNGIEWTRWFTNGKFNITESLLDKWIYNGKGDKIAIITISEDGKRLEKTHHEVLYDVNHLSQWLLDKGIKPGDVVATYMTISYEAVVSLLATLRIGAIFMPIFPGFGSYLVAERLKVASPKLVILNDKYYRKGKEVEVLQNFIEAYKISGIQLDVLLVKKGREGDSLNLLEENKIDFEIFENALRKSKNLKKLEFFESNHPAFLIFTSGTTGKPKGVIIRSIGAILHAFSTAYFNLDLRDGRRYLQVTEMGWVAAPWAIIASFSTNSTLVLIEGAPNYPTTRRILKIIQDEKITHIGMPPTLLRQIMSEEENNVENYNLTSLKVIFTTGEKIDYKTWMWALTKLGRNECPIINNSGGTEVFGTILTPSVITPLKPTTVWGPGLGVDADVIDDYGNSIIGKEGYLVIRKPLPSLTYGLWNDPERYIQTYWSKFPGIYYHGDLAIIDPDGFWFIQGRADDVIKVAGKRIDPAEVEDLIVNNVHGIIECTVVGVPDNIVGEALAVFYRPKEGYDYSEISKNIQKLIIEKLGKTLKPKYIIPVNDLPKSRSGKVLRRVIKEIIANKPVDLTLLENPESIEALKASLKFLSLDS